MSIESGIKYEQGASRNGNLENVASLLWKRVRNTLAMFVVASGAITAAHAGDSSPARYGVGDSLNPTAGEKSVQDEGITKEKFERQFKERFQKIVELRNAISDFNKATSPVLEKLKQKMQEAVKAGDKEVQENIVDEMFRIFDASERAKSLLTNRIVDLNKFVATQTGKLLANNKMSLGEAIKYNDKALRLLESVKVNE